MRNKHSYLLIVLLLLLLVACSNGSETVTPLAATEPATASDPADTPTVAPTATEEAAEVAEVSAESGNLAPPVSLTKRIMPPFPMTMTLDGDLSDWAGVPRVTIPDTSVVAWDTTMTFAAAADDQYLYMMADVIDPIIITDQHGTEYWNEDSVEFYINAAGDPTWANTSTASLKSRFRRSISAEMQTT